MITQYADQNVGPSHYNHLNDDELLITKVFGVTLQGEGPLAGSPAVFVRLAGCNKGDKVSCPWCDTDFRFINGTRMDIPTLTTDITKRFTTHNGYRSPLVIITGGEPMLQNNVVRLIERLLKIGYQVQIESNGDRVARDFSKSTLCNDAMLVVSPKVNPASKKYNKLPKEVFYRADYLKFVVEADPESSYHNLPDYVPEWNMRFRGSPRVYVSPATSYSRPVNVDEIASIWTEGLVNIEETRRNYAHAAQLCREFGYRLSCQLHTLTGIE